MNAPAAFLAVRWLVWDTFRQAQASAVFWLMLSVSVVCILFCFTTATVDLPLRPTDEQGERLPNPQGAVPGVDVIDGELQFLFGAVRVPWKKYRDDAVRWVQLMLAGGIADTAGVLFALIWTAAFLPTFLEPSSVTVLLAKPAPRWSLLVGKYLGVIIFVFVQAAIFVVGTWLALGVKTGVWDARYLASIPLLTLHFAIFFSFSVLLAVTTRSTVVCIVGTLLFWLMCWGMNFGRHALLAYLAEHAEIGRGFSGVLETAYWVLPKPADLGYLLSIGLGAESVFPVHREFKAVIAQKALYMELSVLTSAVFSALMLVVSAYEFEQADY